MRSARGTSVPGRNNACGANLAGAFALAERVDVGVGDQIVDAPIILLCSTASNPGNRLQQKL
jgi:hypothetical protein